MFMTFLDYALNEVEVMFLFVSDCHLTFEFTNLNIVFLILFEMIQKKFNYYLGSARTILPFTKKSHQYLDSAWTIAPFIIHKKILPM